MRALCRVTVFTLGTALPSSVFCVVSFSCLHLPGLTNPPPHFKETSVPDPVPQTKSQGYQLGQSQRSPSLPLVSQ